MQMCNYCALYDFGKNMFLVILIIKKKRGIFKVKSISRVIFFITGSRWPPDSNFTMCKCTSVQCSQILDKKVLLAFLVQKSFWHSMWRILQYHLLFSSNSDYSIQKQPKTAEHLILYTLCNIKNALQAF